MKKCKFVFEVEVETLENLIAQHGIEDKVFLRMWMKKHPSLRVDLERIVKIINSKDVIYLHAVVALIAAQVGLDYMDEQKRKMN